MAIASLSVATSLLPESTLRPRVAAGLAALRAQDRSLIATASRAAVFDSLDLDEATRPEWPHDNRWDYVVAVPRAGQLIGIEPHSANDGEVSVVVAKRAHAVRILRDHLPTNRRIARWLWVASGRVGFSRMDRARRILDQNGIEFVGRQVAL